MPGKACSGGIGDRPTTIAMKVSTFKKDVIDAAATQKEVNLTTFGRKTGKPSDVTIWITTDGDHLYIRSGQGMRRQWPQNLLARGEGVLHLRDMDLKVKPRRVTDPAEARASSELYTRKYGEFVKASKPDEPLTPGEQASFELIPAEQ
jgi:deazaflavin-dependent oxidoreductase (nitroreductase family)